MIELRGKAVADAHKAILQEKVAAVGDSVITMQYYLLVKTTVLICTLHLWKRQQRILAMALY